VYTQFRAHSTLHTLNVTYTCAVYKSSKNSQFLSSRRWTCD